MTTSHTLPWKILIFAGKVAHAFNCSNLEAEVGGDVFEASQVCSSEFQDSQGYVSKPHYKQNQNQIKTFPKDRGYIYSLYMR